MKLVWLTLLFLSVGAAQGPDLKAYVSYCSLSRLCNGESRVLGPPASVAFENRASFERFV